MGIIMDKLRARQSTAPAPITEAMGKPAGHYAYRSLPYSKGRA